MKIFTFNALSRGRRINTAKTGKYPGETRISARKKRENMIFCRNPRILIKTISVIVAGIFLWEQLVFAADLPNNPDPVQIGYEYSVDEFQDQQNNNEALIDTRNAIESFLNNHNEDPILANGVSEDGPFGECSFYENSGRIKSREVSFGNEEGEFYGKNVKYHYLDEDFVDGYGRIERVEVTDNGGDGYLDDGIYELIYSGDTSCIVAVMSKKDVNTNNVTQIFDYYTDSDNRVKSVTFNDPDVAGNILYTFMNEDWKDSGCGRISSIERDVANENGEKVFEYGYYEGTDKEKYIDSFSDKEKENKVVTYILDTEGGITYYGYDDRSNLIWIVYPDGIYEVFEYVYDADRVIETVWFESENDLIVLTEYYDHENDLVICSRTGTGEYANGTIIYDETILDEPKVQCEYTIDNGILVQILHAGAYTDSQNNVIEYYSINKYDAENNLLSATEQLTPAEYADPSMVEAKTLTWTYDGDGDMLSDIRPDGTGYRYEYVKDASGNRREIKTLSLESGQITLEMYDSEGRLLRYFEGEGHWDASMGTIVTDHMSQAAIITNTYTDDEGCGYTVEKHVEYVDAEGEQVNYDEITTYDEFGNVIFYADRNGDVSKFVYNSDGDIVRTVGVDGSIKVYSYVRSEFGELVERTVTDLGENEETLYISTVDKRGNTIYIRDNAKGEDMAIEKIFEYTYEYENAPDEYLASLVETVIQNVPNTAPVTVSVTKCFDADGNVTKIISGDNSSIQYVYYDGVVRGGKKGDLREVIDPRGNKTEYVYEYDAELEYLKKKITKYYLKIDGMLEFDHMFEVRYDNDGRTIYDLGKTGILKTYDYTVVDGVVIRVVENVSYTDVSGNNICLSVAKNYSDDGRFLLSEVLVDGTTKTYIYDNENRVQSTSNGMIKVNYNYDPLTGALFEKVGMNDRGTTDTADDIIKLTVYSGEKGDERVKEKRTFEIGEDVSRKPVIREIYHYNASGSLFRIVKKKLKAAHNNDITYIVENEYIKDLETFYGFVDGKARKMREVFLYGKEEFSYDGDGKLAESTFTDGLYLSKTVKKYDISGKVIRTIKKSGLENLITDIVYIKENTGLITGKTETIVYEKTDENGDILEHTVLSVTGYEYYGEEEADKELYPNEVENHDIKNIYSSGKTRNLEYTYMSNGVLGYVKESVVWTEGNVEYNTVSHRKFDKKGDIVASIDSDGTYSEYEYSTEEENEMGERSQTQKIFYQTKTRADGSTGYEQYHVNSFDNVDTSVLISRKTVRVYDFENDLVKITEENLENAEDSKVKEYLYEKDDFGNIRGKFEKTHENSRVKVTEYTLKNEVISATSYNGVKKKYSYERDPVEGFINKIIETSALYPEYVTIIEVDKYGNDISVLNEKGILKTYTYERSSGGDIVSKTEHITKTEENTVVLDYSEVYKYAKDGQVSEFIDKNGIKSSFSYTYDSNGKVRFSETTIMLDPAGKEKKIMKEYNPDGTIKSMTEINDPLDDLDDIVKSYSYVYDDVTGVLFSKTETDSRYSAQTEYKYDLLGDLISFKSVNGVVTYYLYERDEKGILVKKYTRNSVYTGIIDIQEYDLYGNEKAVITGNGKNTFYQNIYDLKGNREAAVVTKKRCNGDVLIWEFSENRNYDIFGKVISKIDKHGNEYSYSYVTNGQGQVVKNYEFDLRYEGAKECVLDPLTGDILTETDRMGLLTTYEYVRSAENSGILEKKEISDTGEITVYKFNTLGQIESVTDKNGRKVNIFYEFDDCGNMLKRTLTWTETVDGYDREFAEQEFYDVDGDLFRRIDYTGIETRYQYTKNSEGDLTLMTKIESAWVDYDIFDNIYSVSVDGGAQATDVGKVYDGDITTISKMTWTETSVKPRLIIDRDNTILEYNTIQIDLRADTGQGYKYRIYTGTDRNDANTWTIVDDKSGTFYEGFQESAFDAVSDRYIIIEGIGTFNGGMELEIMEARIYNKKEEDTVKIETTVYNDDGRALSKTDTKGNTKFYNYEIGARGEVVKVYEGLTPEATIEVLVPVDIKGVEIKGCYYSPSSEYVYDDNLDSRTNIAWYSGQEPASYVMDLSDGDININDIGGLGLSFREGGWFDYKAYYATAEEPLVWHLLVDQYGSNIDTTSDWHVDKFEALVSAKYIKLRGGPNYAGNNEMDLKEIKVYQRARRLDALSIKTMDVYGREISRKNALMLVWEERRDLREIFPGVNEKSKKSGYWNNKTLTDWAKMIGSREDARLDRYLSDYNNKTDPVIKETFTKGDKTNCITGITVHNYSSSENAAALTDNNFNSWGYVEWTNDDNPAYYIVELAEETTIDKIRLKLFNTDIRKYKYSICVSSDGITWGDPVVVSDGVIGEDWQEHAFLSSAAKFLKIEGITGWYEAPNNPLRQLAIEEIMLFDSADDTPPETELTSAFSGVSVHNISDSAYYNSIIDDSEDSWANIEWAGGNPPAYFVLDLSSEKEIDKISINLCRDYGMFFKYKIYGSVDGITWGDPLVDATDTFLEGKQYHLFDPTTVKYIKIEGYSALYGSSVLTRIMVSDLRIFMNGQAGYCGVKEYTADIMRDWAKNCGFRHDAKLIKFARLNGLTDKADVVDTTYKLDDKGTMRKKTELSVYGGVVKKFFDEKGRLVNERIGMVSDSNADISENNSFDQYSAMEVVEEIDSCGNLIKEIYPMYPSKGDYLSGSEMVSCEPVELLGARIFNEPGDQSLRDRVMDGDMGTHIGAQWDGDIPAAFLLTLKEASEINKIRFCLSYNNNNRYRVYVRADETEAWDIVADNSDNSPVDWQEIIVDRTDPVKQIKIEGVEVGGLQKELDIWEINIYKPVLLENVAYIKEYNTDGDLACEKNILAHVWETNERLRECFLTPESQGTGIYNNWTLKRWAIEIGSVLDPRLSSYATGTDAASLEDPYIVVCSYSRDEDTVLLSKKEMINFKRQRLTFYNKEGIVTETIAKTINLTSKDYNYSYFENGNVRELTMKKTGYEAGENVVVYNHGGDVVKNNGYKYEYVYDKWKNIEKLRVNGQEEIFLTTGQILDEVSAAKRIVEYFRAMLYREPTAEELEFYLADWRSTGFASFARDNISMTDEYLCGTGLTFAEKALIEQVARVAGIQQGYNASCLAYEEFLAELTDAMNMMSDARVRAETVYSFKKDKNDKKYITEIYRQELGREPTSEELDDQLVTLRENNWTLEDLRESLRNDAEYTLRKERIQSIINYLYDPGTGKGLLADYVNAADKEAFLSGMGLDVSSKFIIEITINDLEDIVNWLRSQDNHFGRSAVEALYKQLEASGTLGNVLPAGEGLSIMETLLIELIFIDIISGVISPAEQGMLLLSMYSIKKLSKKYALNVYGTAYSFEELLEKLNEIEGFSGIIQYNGNHFLNITGVIRDANGNITHILVTNGYIDGVEQTKEIRIGEFKENYEGKILSTERSDYDKRLTDEQLRNIRGAGWWKNLWKAIAKAFKAVIKAVVDFVMGIVNAVVGFIKAIGHAFMTGKWGRIFCAIGVIIVTIVASIFTFGQFLHLIPLIFMVMSSMVGAMNVATAICYGQYTQALIGGAILVASMVLSVVGGAIGGLLNGIGAALKTAVSWVGSKITAICNVMGEIVKTAWGAISTAAQWVGDKVAAAYTWAADKYSSFLRDIKTFGDDLFASNSNSFMNMIGNDIREVSGEVAKRVLFRYINEEIGSTSNWLGKIGIGILGSLALTTTTAFASPNFDVSTMYLSDMLFDGMNMVVSQEAYKSLEDELGEEWYGDLLRSSVNSVISAGFSVMKNAVHGAIVEGYNKTDLPDDVTEEKKQQFEEKIKAIAQAENDKLRQNPDEQSKLIGVAVDEEKKKGQITVKNAQTNEVESVTIFDFETGESKTTNFTEIKECLKNVMGAVFTAGAQILTNQTSNLLKPSTFAEAIGSSLGWYKGLTYSSILLTETQLASGIMLGEGIRLRGSFGLMSDTTNLATYGADMLKIRIYGANSYDADFHFGDYSIKSSLVTKYGTEVDLGMTHIGSSYSARYCMATKETIIENIPFTYSISNANITEGIMIIPIKSFVSQGIDVISFELEMDRKVLYRNIFKLFGIIF